MKKFFTLFALMVCACLQMAAQFTPVDGKTYMIQEKSTGLYVAFDANYTKATETNAKNAVYLQTEGTEFTVTAGENGGFVFESTVNDETWYIAQSSINWNFSNDAATEWTLEDAGNDTYYFKGSHGYWKFDNAKAGAYLYCDGGKSAARKLAIVEVSANFVNTAELESAINTAKNYQIGTKALQEYSGMTAAEWANAVAAAQAVLDDASHTQATVDAAAAALEAATESLVQNPADPDKWYILTHVESGLYLNINTTLVNVMEEGTPVQFVPVDGVENGYNIGSMSSDGETLLQIGQSGANVSLNTDVQTLVAIPAAAGEFALQSSITGYDCFGCIYRESYGAYNGCSYDTHVAATNSHWTMEEYSETPVEPTGWDGTYTINPADGASLDNFDQARTITITFNGAKEVTVNNVIAQMFDDGMTKNYLVCAPAYAAYGYDNMGTATVDGSVVTLNLEKNEDLLGCVDYQYGDLLVDLLGNFTVDGTVVDWSYDNLQELHYTLPGTPAPSNAIYVLGIDGNWDPCNASITVTPTEMGEYIFNYTNESDAWFALGTKLGIDNQDWDTFNQFRLSAPSADYQLAKGDVVALTEGGSNSFFIPAGEWQFQIDRENMTLTVIKGAEPAPEWTPASIEIRGSFNDWGTTPLTWSDDAFAYVGSMDLEAGSYEFKIAADGAWDHNWGGELPEENQIGTLYKNGNNLTLTLDQKSTFTYFVGNVTDTECGFGYQLTPIEEPATFAPVEGQAYTMMVGTSNVGVDFNTLVSDTDGCTTLPKATATPTKVYFTAVDGGWTIMSEGKYLAPYKNATGSLKWSATVTDEPYVWTIEGTNEDFTLQREDGKYVKCENSKFFTDASASAACHFNIVEVKTYWNGNVTATMTDALTAEVTFDEADAVAISNFGVLGAIYNEGGEITALVWDDGYFQTAGSVEIEGRKATVHFQNIEDLKNNGTDTEAVIKKIGGFNNNGKATAYICTKSFKVDGTLSDAIQANLDGSAITGINTIALDSNAKVYDLQGRRVVAPAKSMIFIQNGKKVIR